MKVRSLIFCAVLVATAAHADPWAWDARGLLANTGTKVNVIELQTRDFVTVDEIDRAAVQRYVDVAGRIAAAFDMKQAQLAIEEGKSPDASASWRTGRLQVRVNLAMLRLVGNNDDALAAVVAHTLAHVQAGHTSADLSRAQEIEADQLGARAMVSAGFNPHNALPVWKALDARRTWWTEAHPPYADREGKLLSIAQETQPVATAPTAPAATDPKSVGLLALKFVNGDGGAAKDYARARVYAEMSAGQGDLVGLAVLGALTRDGIGGLADVDKGIAMLEKSAQGGTAWAHYQLGLTFERGLGVKQDRERALRHYKAAAPEMAEAAERAAALSK